MNPKHKAVFAMYEAGKDVATIASSMGYAIQTISGILSKGRALGEITRRQRSVAKSGDAFKHRVLQMWHANLSYAEIADREKTNVKTIDNCIRRMRQSLGDAMVPARTVVATQRARKAKLIVRKHKNCEKKIAAIIAQAAKRVAAIMNDASYA